VIGAIKKDQMVCGNYRGEKAVLTRFWLGKLKEIEHFEDLGTKIITE
jgi:hypothetical protein